MKITIAYILFALAVSMVTPAPAQERSLVFEVASIKPHGKSEYIPLDCSHGRFISNGLPFSFIIAWAYELNAAQEAALEEQLQPWAKYQDYNIEAKSEREVTKGQCRDMMKALLGERLNLSLHTIVKESKLYELIVGRGGHRMQQVTDVEIGPGYNVIRNGSLIQTLPGTPAKRGMTMPEFADRLSSYIKLVPVIDKTGLQGMYKINLSFSTGSGLDQPFSDPDIFTAIQIQLGLKMEERKGPVSSFIVDHIDRPEAN